MKLAIKQPFISIGSDGSAISPEGPRGSMHPHPRWYGTFPRVLGRYVRELKVLTLAQAVRKMTSMNADKISLPGRGLLKVGYWADITLFDPERVIDRATFEDPQQYPLGFPTSSSMARWCWTTASIRARCRAGYCADLGTRSLAHSSSPHFSPTDDRST